ncbi:MAG: D-alanyl-D-alanine carboxypeptidase [Oscillospiraceae bacterium]|nr:D-alanyl-D-alanine carboxypeptidase [Oscillospiraceae bacterium]
MKKLISIMLALLLAFSAGTAAFAAGSGITISAKSAILIERSTGRVLFEYEADTPMPPASITKIMTLLLVMEAIESGKLTMETEVTASEHACSMGGSQIWLEPGEVFTVHELLKAAAIASANDACAALAEAVSGTEEAFVELMNQRAAELGMKNTVFKNCTGLDAEGHVSTARDIAIMSAELLSHEKIKEYSTVWMDSLRNGETELTNTNRLVRFYKGCTGLKTGSTDEAGCCLAASAERDGMELISVTLGSPNTDERFAAGRKLLDYGFANFAVVKPEPPAEQISGIPVTHGTADSVMPVFDTPKTFLLPKGQEGQIEQKVTLPESLEAPVEKGQIIGKVTVSLNGGEIGEYNILAGEGAEKMSFFAALKILFLEAISTC